MGAYATKSFFKKRLKEYTEDEYKYLVLSQKS